MGELAVMKQIVKIHGTSSQITFDLEDSVIIGSGEFIAGTGKIDGFSVSAASLEYRDGTRLSAEECCELEERYREYLKTHGNRSGLSLEFV